MKKLNGSSAVNRAENERMEDRDGNGGDRYMTKEGYED
jgi:hypothetical protein